MPVLLAVTIIKALLSALQLISYMLIPLVLFISHPSGDPLTSKQVAEYNFITTARGLSINVSVEPVEPVEQN